MKREAIHTWHSWFEPKQLTRASILNSTCPELIIPIGINIHNVPGGKPSRRDVGDLSFHNRSCRNCSNELSVSEPGPDQYMKVSLAVAKLVP